MTRARRTGALTALLVAGAPSVLHAWGSATHQWITHQALLRVADDPAVAPLAREPRLRAALLGGAVAPDMMLALAPLAGDRATRALSQLGHRAFKDRRIAERLITSARTGEEWASGLGFLCHYLQDEVGDHRDGYPSRKESVAPQHGLFNEVMLDLLVLAEADAPITPIAIDPTALSEAADEFGYSLEVGDLRRARRAFAWARAALRGFLRAIIAGLEGPVLDGVGAFYQDAAHGLGGQPGIEELVRRTASAIRHYARTRPNWISHLRTSRRPLQEPAPPLVEGLVQDGAQLLYPVLVALDLPALYPELLEYQAFRHAPLLMHLLNVWVLAEEDFARACARATELRRAGMARYQERRRERRRRARRR